MRSSTLLALAALGLVSLAARPAVAGTLFVPQQFPTIQKALNAARPYDTVLVSAKPKGGVYSEAITISTPHVTLQGFGNPVLDGSGFVPISVPIPGSYYSNTVYPDAIDIHANDTVISGLTVQNVPGLQYGGIGGNAISAGYTSADGTTAFGYSGIRISGVTLSNDFNGIVVSGFGAQVVNGKYTFTSAQGFSLLGCTITGSANYAASISSTNNVVISGSKFLSNAHTGLNIGSDFLLPTSNALIAGNVFKNNGYDGLDAYGTGLTVTANEAGLNGNYGMLVDTLPINFFGAGATPTAAAPTAPAPTSLLFNSVHDNGLVGLYITGAQTISANSIANNSGYGIYLENADLSTVSLNSITGTGLAVPANAQAPFDNGTGIFADDPGVAFGPVVASASEKIVGNQISGSAGDGIYLGAVTGCTLSANNVTGSLGIGIQASDFPSPGNTPNTITQNRVVHNAVFDLRDQSNAADDLTYNGSDFSGDNYFYNASINVWTKNIFGTEDPAGLSK